MRSIAQLSCHSTVTRPQSDAIRRIDRHLIPAKDQEGSLVRVGHWTMVVSGRTIRGQPVDMCKMNYITTFPAFWGNMYI